MNQNTMSEPIGEYLRYDDLTEMLRGWADAHPDVMSLESIGKSHEGREIWLVTLTRKSTGDHGHKPATWVDGNIHATELAASTACLELIRRILHGDGHEDGISRALDTRTFYICPRVNPDGAEWALADSPRYIRSSTRPWPMDLLDMKGLTVEDIDGDGRILTMRVPDPNGPWKVHPDEPRLMVQREPTETDGSYYRLLPEGLLERYDGVQIELKRDPQGLDLNRNFPSGWRVEADQKGAGPYPTSEPEVRTIVDFVSKHPNICCGITFHTFSGVLLRPFSDKADSEFPVIDLRTYQRIGAKGEELTGYPAISVYHYFRYDPKQVITGAFDDWLFNHLGIYGWTVEIWGPRRAAGIEFDDHFGWYFEHPVEDDLKLLAWNDHVLDGQGYIDWYTFEHPQLGTVELGGWDAMYTFRNPPVSKLADEVSRFPDWVVWHGLLSPLLEMDEVLVEHRGTTADGSQTLFHVKLVVRNSGWLPTQVTGWAEEKKLVPGVICRIELPRKGEMVPGDKEVELGQLKGRNHKGSAVHAWVADPTDNLGVAEWMIAAQPGENVVLTARHPRAGRKRIEVELPGPG